MEGLSLVQDFAVILLVAAAAGWLLRRIGLSAVVGYLLAGVVVGPFTPPFSLITDLTRIQSASQLGLVFLMFFVGLNLNLAKIRRLGIQIIFATIVTATLVNLFAQTFASLVGWNGLQALLFAAALVSSSSAIISKMLSENKLTHERFARTALGLTVLEDIVAVIMLTLIGSRLGSDIGGGDSIGRMLLLLLGFVVILLVVGLLLIPRLFEKVGRSDDSDLKSILVTGLLFAAGVAAVNAGFSIALGAFLFGVVVAETRFSSSIERRMVGAQDMFSAMFFVSIGMLIDVTGIYEHIPMILLVAAFAITARAVAATTAFLVTGIELKIAVASALTVTPIGEFAYIVAQIGVASAVFDESFYLIAVAASIVTAVSAPLLVKYSSRVAEVVDSLQPAFVQRWLERYRTWLSWVGELYSSNLSEATLRTAGMTAVELFLLIGILGFSEPVADFTGEFLTRANVAFAWWQPMYWAIISLIGLILIVVIVRGMVSLCGTLASFYAGLEPEKAGRRRFVKRILVVIGLLELFFLVIWLLPVPVKVPWFSLFVVGLASPIVILYWRKILRVHSQFQSSLQRAMEHEDPGHASSKLMRGGPTPENWNVEILEFVLPEQSVHAASSIKDARLRSQFGCSIVEVERQGRVVTNPRPEFLLFPEDRLLLFGSPEQVASGAKFLSEEGKVPKYESDFDETVLETLEVPEGFPKTGQTLAELRVFNVTGVQLMGIERDGKRILNPSGGEMLKVGDQVLALGSQGELRNFRTWLRDANDLNAADRKANDHSMEDQ